jgi:uncharacterized membrane protein YhhN
LPLITVCVALLIRAELRFDKRQIYVLKPLATLLVIALALTAPDLPIQTGYRSWVLLGLALCLGGDIALMFQDRRRPFLVGLVLFLLGHVAYSVAFSLHAEITGWTLWALLLLLVAGLAFYRLIAAGLGQMRLPVILYFLVISLMVVTAASVAGNPAIAREAAWLVLAGAGLFYISDVMLAANRFWRPWKYNRLSLAFYYGGQALIALSTHQLA